MQQADMVTESQRNTAAYQRQLQLQPEDNQRLQQLCGLQNAHLQTIEQYLKLIINSRGFVFVINGDNAKAVKSGEKILRNLYQKAINTHLDAESVHLEIMSQLSQQTPVSNDACAAPLYLGQKIITAKTVSQHNLLNNIRANDCTINFAIGPAGCGKTYLAIAAAIEALNQHSVSKIILTRPAVEAGENLGFLPGDMAEKIAPYLQPLYDVLYELLGKSHTTALIEKNIIEIAPLAFMRGRTLKDSFIIVDEAQNATKEQMKMLLTRIGNASKMLVAGDVTQTDLPHHKQSGLQQALLVLQGVELIRFNYLDQADILRHPVVQQVVAAYGRSD